jgi:hypothetical protein
MPGMLPPFVPPLAHGGWTIESKLLGRWDAILVKALPTQPMSLFFNRLDLKNYANWPRTLAEVKIHFSR